MEIERKVWDVNILAIFLVEDHPGHKYVAPIVEDGLRGRHIPILLDILPIRAYWILERRWKIPRELAARAVTEFVKEYRTPRYVSLTRHIILESFKLARKLHHDVYDCVYLAVALDQNATSIITTDKGLEKPCRALGIRYENPVPTEILRKFANYSRAENHSQSTKPNTNPHRHNKD